MSEDTDAAAAFGGAQTPSWWRRRRVLQLFGGLLMAAGVVGAIAWGVAGFMGLSDAVDDLHRVPIPGSRVVELSEGRQAVYYEGRGGEDADVPPLRVSVAPAGGGAPLEVGAHGGSVTYSMSGHAGRSIAGFGVPRDGRYRVAVSGAPSSAQIAVGKGVGGRIVRALVGAFAIFFLGAGLGTVLLVLASRR